jgi:hypothetical protein
MLAERVEGIVSSEHRSWLQLQTKNVRKDSESIPLGDPK